MTNSELDMVQVDGLTKNFTLHNQGGIKLSVLRDINLKVKGGECVVLNGPSGAGKSSLLRCLYRNYQSDSGRVLIQHDGAYVDIVSAAPRDIIAIRRHTIGYVSQFLRVIPRVSTLDVVSEPLRREGYSSEQARQQAGEMLERLNVPESLWELAPATISGGEQQRVNIARGFIRSFPVLLLDEPTSALDAVNREVVISLIEERKKLGTAIIGIFHDEDVRERVATRLLDMAPLKDAA